MVWTAASQQHKVIIIIIIIIKCFKKRIDSC